MRQRNQNSPKKEEINSKFRSENKNFKIRAETEREYCGNPGHISSRCFKQKDGEMTKHQDEKMKLTI